MGDDAAASGYMLGDFAGEGLARLPKLHVAPMKLVGQPCSSGARMLRITESARGFQVASARTFKIDMEPKGHTKPLF